MVSERMPSQSDTQPAHNDRIEATWQNHFAIKGVVPASAEVRQARMEEIRRALSKEPKDTAGAPAERPADTPDDTAVMSALVTAFDFIAHDNRLRGMQDQLHDTDSEFNERYNGEASQVYAGSQRNRDYKQPAYEDSLRILFAARTTTPELAAVAQAEDFDAFKRLFEEAYGGTGREYQGQRKKLKDRAKLQLGGQLALSGYAATDPSRSHK